MSALRSHASVKVSTGPVFLWKWMFVFRFQNSSRRHLECPCPKSLQMTGPTSSSRTYRGTSKRMHPILLPPSSHLEVKDKTKNCQAVTHLSAPPRKHQMSRRRQTPRNQLLGPGGGWVVQYFLCSQCEDNQRCMRLFSEPLLMRKLEMSFVSRYVNNSTQGEFTLALWYLAPTQSLSLIPPKALGHPSLFTYISHDIPNILHHHWSWSIAIFCCVQRLSHETMRLEGRAGCFCSSLHLQPRTVPGPVNCCWFHKQSFSWNFLFLRHSQIYM